MFSSNLHNPKGWNFDFSLIDTVGNNLEQVTTSGSFDGFPMFSPDGKKLVLLPVEIRLNIMRIIFF